MRIKLPLSQSYDVTMVDSSAASLRLGSGSNYVGFKAPATLSADKIWVLPSADGTSGQPLTTDGNGNLVWANFPASLPTQTGNGGKVLTTDGTNASWSAAGSSLPSMTGKSDMILGTDGSISKWVDQPVTSVFEWLTDDQIAQVKARTHTYDVAAMTTALNQAIADTSEGTLYFPNGTYYHNGLTINTSVNLVGEGFGFDEVSYVPGTQLYNQSTTNPNITVTTSNHVNTYDVGARIFNMSLHGMGSGTATPNGNTDVGIFLHGASNTLIDRVQVYVTGSHGIVVDRGSNKPTIMNSSVFKCSGDAIHMQQANGSYQILSIKILNNEIHNNYGHGISIWGSCIIVMYNTIQSNGGAGVFMGYVDATSTSVPMRFDNATKTITRTDGKSFKTENYADGCVVTPSGTTSNNLAYTVATSGVTDSTLTLTTSPVTEGSVTPVTCSMTSTYSCDAYGMWVKYNYMEDNSLSNIYGLTDYAAGGSSHFMRNCTIEDNNLLMNTGVNGTRPDITLDCLHAWASIPTYRGLRIRNNMYNSTGRAWIDFKGMHDQNTSLEMPYFRQLVFGTYFLNVVNSGNTSITVVQAVERTSTGPDMLSADYIGQISRNTPDGVYQKAISVGGGTSDWRPTNPYIMAAFPVKYAYPKNTIVLNSGATLLATPFWIQTSSGASYSTTRADAAPYTLGTWAAWPTGTSVWECTTAGTTTTGAPAIGTPTSGSPYGTGATTVTDGTVVWTCRGTLKATWVPMEAYNAQGAGVKGGNLNAAIASLTGVGGGFYYVDSTTTVTANATIPSNITLVIGPNSALNQSTYTLTINGDLQVGTYRAFSGTGAVTIDNGSSFVRPEWWYSGSGTWETAIVAACNAANLVPVLFSAATYNCDSFILPKGSILKGVGSAGSLNSTGWGTKLHHSPTVSGTVFIATDTVAASTVAGVTIKDLVLDTNAAGNTSVALEMKHMLGAHISNVSITGPCSVAGIHLDLVQDVEFNHVGISNSSSTYKTPIGVWISRQLGTISTSVRFKECYLSGTSTWGATSGMDKGFQLDSGASLDTVFENCITESINACAADIHQYNTFDFINHYVENIPNRAQNANDAMFWIGTTLDTYTVNNCSGTSGLFTVTSTDGTMISAGLGKSDYVTGTGIGASAQIASIDSANQITLTVANSGTVSGSLVFQTKAPDTAGTFRGGRLSGYGLSGTGTLGFYLNKIDNLLVDGMKMQNMFPLYNYTSSGFAYGVCVFTNNNGRCFTTQSAFVADNPTYNIDVRDDNDFLAYPTFSRTRGFYKDVPLLQLVDGTKFFDIDKRIWINYSKVSTSWVDYKGSSLSTTNTCPLRNWAMWLDTGTTPSTWTKGTGWTIASGKATHASGTASNLSQVGIVSTTSYTIDYTITGMTTGTLTLACGSATGTGRTANGTYTDVITANGTTFSAQATSTFDGSITINSFVPAASLSVARNVQNGNYSVLPSDSYVVYKGTGGNTYTLPTAGHSMDQVIIKNAGTGTLIVDGLGAETIDGVASYQLNAPMSITLFADGATNWEVN